MISIQITQNIFYIVTHYATLHMRRDLAAITSVVNKAAQHEMLAHPHIITAQNTVSTWIQLTEDIKIAVEDRNLPKIELAIEGVKKEKIEARLDISLFYFQSLIIILCAGTLRRGFENGRKVEEMAQIP